MVLRHPERIGRLVLMDTHHGVLDDIDHGLIALGVEPGPRMGLLLKTLYERQLDGEITSTDDGLVAARLLVDHASGPDA